MVIILVVFRAKHDSCYHPHESHEAYQRGYHDAACAKDVGLKVRFGRARSGHQQQTDDNDYYTYSDEDKVDLVEG